MELGPTEPRRVSLMPAHPVLASRSLLWVSGVGSKDRSQKTVLSAGFCELELGGSFQLKDHKMLRTRRKEKSQDPNLVKIRHKHQILGLEGVLWISYMQESKEEIGAEMEEISGSVWLPVCCGVCSDHEDELEEPEAGRLFVQEHLVAEIGWSCANCPSQWQILFQDEATYK